LDEFKLPLQLSRARFVSLIVSALALGQYYGRVPQRWSAESMAMSVVVHDQKRANVRHAHEPAFLTLMLDGQYRETTAQRSLAFDRFTTIYHPSGIEHQDFIGTPGVRLLMFEFRPELLEGAPTDRSRFRSVRDLSGSMGAWQLLSLYRRAAGADPLEFESGAMRLLARIAPLARTPRDRPSLERAREFVHARFRDRVTMRDIASAAGVHPVHLGQSFHREYGETLGSYVARLRVRAAAEALSGSETPLATIAYDHGFCDQSHFQRVFKRLTGVTPGGFRHSFSNET